MDDVTRKERQNLTTADLAQSGETRTGEGFGEERTMQQQRSARENRPPAPSGQGQNPMAAAAAPSKAREEQATPLFATNDAASLRSRWESVQVGFVDEPRRSVEQADQLVAEAIKHLAEGFAGEKQKLEKQWDRGDKVSTEDLRQSLRRYRSFFERLLAV